MFNNKEIQELKETVKMQGELISALVEQYKSINNRVTEVEDKVFPTEPKYFGGK